MSFFCGPMRLRNKKRRGSGESLLQDLDSLNAAKIPNDPAAKMTVLYDFIACLKDELSVSKGQKVDILDVDRKWAYVAASKGRGFVPLSCLGPSTPPTESTKTSRPLPQPIPEQDDDSLRLGDESEFKKAFLGQYVVLYDFTAQDENDASVVVGDCISSFNEEDPDWTWVLKDDGSEGFVPRAYLYSDSNATDDVSESVQGSSHSSEANLHKLQLCGTELMSLYDYQGRIADDLTVVRGDLLYADMTNQTHDEWLWAYCPRTRMCGFIPKGYARPPALE